MNDHAPESLKSAEADAVAELSAQHERVQELERELAVAQREISKLQDENWQIRRSKSWRLTSPLRALKNISSSAYSKARRKIDRTASAATRTAYHVLPLRLEHKMRFKGYLFEQMGPAFAKTEAYSRWQLARQHALPTDEGATPVAMQHEQETLKYLRWIETFDRIDETDEVLIGEHIEAGFWPPVHIVWRVSSEHHDAVQRLLDSLDRQLFKSWTLTLVSNNLKQLKLVCKGRQDDSRIKLKGPDALRSGKGIPDKRLLLMFAPLVLRPHALYMIASAAAQGASLVYSDSDRIDRDGTRNSPEFRPNFSPELARQTNYFGSCLYVNALADIGLTLGELLEPAIAAKAVASRVNAGKSIRIPFVLYHGTDAKPVPVHSGHRWVTESTPTVSIMIPTRDNVDLLEACISSIFELTDYPRDKIQIVIIDNGSTKRETADYLQGLAKHDTVKVLRDDRPFNYPRLNNLAASHSTGEILILLNNDTLILDPRWIRRLVYYALMPDVGVVGGKLLYSDRTVQHGGVIFGIGGVAGHAHLHLAENDPGYLGLSNVDHDISACTGACLAVRRDLYKTLGGLDENLAVAFNDVLLCAEAISRGYRNIYVGTPLIIHLESKTRGFDDNPEKIATFRREAKYSADSHPNLFKNDPFYNPNLSLERPYDLSFPPRVAKPWHRARSERTKHLKVLMLSVVHSIGHGVPLVIDQQARHLAQLGHKVYVGGPPGANEFPYDGCERVILHDPFEAATFAISKGVDCVVMHTPPFFSTVRWLGDAVKTLAYDYGEPPPDMFPDAVGRRAVNDDKKFWGAWADELYAISEVVRAESGEARMGVIPIANSHFLAQGALTDDRRRRVRTAHDWHKKIVVLMVCRFHEAERAYKGVNAYLDLIKKMRETGSFTSPPIEFVLCGKATESDVEQMRSEGLTVFANVSDDEMVDLYNAADIYVSFSRWEGYNLGVAQALAFGLPVIASDIPAHRAFGVFTSNSTDICARQLSHLAGELRDRPMQRRPKIWEWSDHLQKFTDVLENLSARGH